MSWDPRDSMKPRDQRNAMPPPPDTMPPPPGPALPGTAAQWPETALPTVAAAQQWLAQSDEAPVAPTLEQRRALAAMGIWQEAEWSAYRTIVTRGIAAL